VLPQFVFAQVESAESFVAPEGCALSHDAKQAFVVQFAAQSRSAMQSLSPRQAFASPQQFVSRHVSQVAAPLANPQVLVLGGGPPPPPPQAVVQLDSMQVKSPSRIAAPVGWAEKQALKHVSSVHALPHVMSAVQSVSFTHAAFCVQQLVSRHVSQVVSPVESPHFPPPAIGRVPGVSLLPPREPPESAASPDAFFGFASASFDLNAPEASSFGAVDSGFWPSVVVVVVSVTVHANVIADVMAITPKVVSRMCPPRGQGAA